MARVIVFFLAALLMGTSVLSFSMMSPSSSLLTKPRLLHFSETRRGSPLRASSFPPDEDLSAQLKRQQQRIAHLESLLSASSSPPSDTSSVSFLPPPSPLSPPPPKRAMLFIDGTWLYYSLYRRGHDPHLGRVCPISSKLGPDWQSRYRFRWEQLPSLLSRLLSSGSSAAAYDVGQTRVYTSAKSGGKDPLRTSMYKDMINAGFDVQVLETQGSQEKCVDIQLAVDMMHYTGPRGFAGEILENGEERRADMAVVLTGDLDFRPALERVRSKGGEVCLVSIRASCNKELSRVADVGASPPNIVWLEEHLDELLQEDDGMGRPKTSRLRLQPDEIAPSTPNTSECSEPSISSSSSSSSSKATSARLPSTSGFVVDPRVDKALLDFAVASAVHQCACEESTGGNASPRMVGRHLKRIKVPLVGGKEGGGGKTGQQFVSLLSVLKEKSGSLVYHLMSNRHLFQIIHKELQQDGEETFEIALKSKLSDLKDEVFSDETIDLYKKLVEGILSPLTSYPVATFPPPFSSPLVAATSQHLPVSVPNSSVRALEQQPHKALKQQCVTLGLHVSGTKAVLAERIAAFFTNAEEEKKGRETADEKTAVFDSSSSIPSSSSSSSSGFSSSSSFSSSSPPQSPLSSSAPPPLSVPRSVLPYVDPKSLTHLKSLILGFVSTSGTCGSRDVGRFLSNQKDSRSGKNGDDNALHELKEKFGTVVGFMKRFLQDDILVTQNAKKNEDEFYENKQNANNVGDFYTVRVKGKSN